jgi:putative sigma-54 modulation protein
MKEAERQPYPIQIVGKHLLITEAMRSYVFGKLDKVKRLSQNITDIHVTLEVHKLIHSCTFLVNFGHVHIKISADTEDIYSAIDKALDRVCRLMRKYKEKLHSHRWKDITTVDIHVNVIQPLEDDVRAINDEIEAVNVEKSQGQYGMHSIVAKETVPLKTLTRDEAVMKMEFSGEPFLLFRSEEEQIIQLIYRRADENYGLVRVQ